MSTTCWAHVTVMPVPLASRLASMTTTSPSPLNLSRACTKAYSFDFVQKTPFSACH
jgi:hypothetical protein